MKINLEKLEEYLTRKELVWIGVISMFFALVFFTVSYFFITSTIKAVTASKDQGDRNVSQDVCMSSLMGISGLKVRSDGRDVVVLSAEGLENAALKLGKASAASLVCPGWELSSFCMGESCENGEGLLFELQIID
jgi:hypothetical protein